MLTSIDNTIVIIFIPKASIYCLLFLAVNFIPYITDFFLILQSAHCLSLLLITAKILQK